MPARFRRPRLLIVGCGDIGLRVAGHLAARMRVIALTSSPGRIDELRTRGILPVLGDLDQPRTLARLAGVATRVVHLAPPPGEGWTDPRTRALVAVLLRRNPPQVVVYGSTSGVYGDCAGAWVDETRPVAPLTDRARRRVDAERALLEWGARSEVRISILRVPGIYAADRLPIERLRQGTPALLPEDDVFTNHIHADDLAMIVVAALERATAGAIYNASDDSEMKMGEYFDLISDRAGLPRPQRISRAAAAGRISPMLLSFMNESRRLVNARMKRELGVRLRYPTVREGVPASIVVPA